MLMLFAEYVKIVDEDILAYTDEGRQFAQHGDMQKAQLMLTKKKLAEKEVCQRQVKIMSCLPETHTIIIYITFSWKSRTKLAWCENIIIYSLSVFFTNCVMTTLSIP